MKDKNSSVCSAIDGGVEASENYGHKQLDQQLAAFYRSQSLPVDRLKRINQEASSLIEAEEQKSDKRTRWLYMVAGVAIVCSLLSVSVLFEYGESDSAEQSRSAGVAEKVEHTVTLALREAVLNHRTKLQFDYQPGSVAALQSSMSKLPFRPELPVSISNQQAQLVGARYCSIEGELAAHLRFVDSESDREFSLFMASAAPALDSLQEVETSVDDVAVQLWREQGLVYLKTVSLD